MTTTENYNPQLRFPEFDDHWQRSNLKEVAKVERGRFSPRPRNNPIYYGGDIPFVQTSDVVNSNGKICKYTQTLNEKGLKVSKLFPAGTILITIAANIGYSGVLEIDMACPDSLIGIRSKDNVSTHFLNFYLSTQQKIMDYLAPKGAQRNINIEFLNPYPFSFPTLPEQQKIAAFLAAADQKIAQLTRKKELLEQYKKGLMQKIFSREIRFKQENGENYPEWEEKRLGELANFVGGGTPSTKNNKYWEGDIPWISSSDLNDDSIYQINATRFINRDAIENSATKLIPSNSILIVTRVGVGKAAVNSYPLCTSQDFTSLVSISSNPIFLAYFIKNKVQNLNELNQGTSIKGIVTGDLKGLKFPIPIMEEQQKIANYLSKIDEKLESVKTQITHTQNFKKGLLQQLFV